MSASLQASWPRPASCLALVLERIGAAALVLALLAPLLLSSLSPLGSQAHAMKIQTVRSPGGIQAWLVEERSIPLLALRFAFGGGNAQDPAGKEGVANFLTAMMDEGAGDLTDAQFQERMEELAMRMRFSDDRDTLYGSFETLTVNRDAAVDLLRLALTRPRFDGEAIERVRKQLLAGLAYAAKDPNSVAGKEWNAQAFAGHPYARPANGTPESVAAINRDDLVSFHRRVFARSTLKVAAVGDIDATTLGLLLDKLFAELPARSELTPVTGIMPKTGGVQKVVEMNVPQSVAQFGLGGLPRKDPDFIPAFVMNHILGGGGFSSRLMEEVREKRGLAYGVSMGLWPYQHASILAGHVATKNEEIGQSLDVIRAELRRMATEGPTAAELDNAKQYLTGSYALRFDTNAKIADQLLGIQRDDLGIDYVAKRNKLIEAVTLADVKRLAARLLKADDLIVVIVGKPKNLSNRS
jgi:zinc protease